MKPSDIQRRIEVASSGINRFFDEGYTRWPESKFRSLFQGVPLENPEVAAAIALWVANGSLSISNPRDPVFEILKLINDPITLNET